MYNAIQVHVNSKPVALKVNLEVVNVNVPEMDTGDLYVNHVQGLMVYTQLVFVQVMVRVQPLMLETMYLAI